MGDVQESGRSTGGLTPGQAAYSMWVNTGGLATAFAPQWSDLNDEMQERWERVARAAIANHVSAAILRERSASGNEAETEGSDV